MGTFLFPCLFITAIEAVAKKQMRVTKPTEIIKGLAKKGENAIAFNTCIYLFNYKLNFDSRLTPTSNFYH